MNIYEFIAANVMYAVMILISKFNAGQLCLTVDLMCMFVSYYFSENVNCILFFDYNQWCNFEGLKRREEYLFPSLKNSILLCDSNCVKFKED